MLETIAFDADDTLWHNEPLFLGAQERFKDLLAAYHDRAWIAQRLYETEVRNLRHFGYGIKGFTLSMIETAVELTEGRIEGHDVRQLVALAKEMLAAPVDLLPGVGDTLDGLAGRYRLLLITKGDLFDQESKLARSGLGELFDGIEVVARKEPPIYAAILRRYQIEPEAFLMVGNSLRSDILPVVTVGGHAAHIPYETTWAHEVVPEAELDDVHFHALPHISEVPHLAASLADR